MNLVLLPANPLVSIAAFLWFSACFAWTAWDANKDIGTTTAINFFVACVLLMCAVPLLNKGSGPLAVAADQTFPAMAALTVGAIIAGTLAGLLYRVHRASGGEPAKK
jgi:hypothetical protein